MLKRLIDWHLLKWKENVNRKALLIRGARQVGKTHSVRTLGKTFDQLIEINFELTRDAKKIFEKDLKPERILNELTLFSGKKIEPGKTLLFLDEVQEAPEAIQALRYFFEFIPSLHVIAAGSLLDFALEEAGLPVGRVSSLYLYPMSFLEFLSAKGESLLIEAILNHNRKEPMAEVIHLKLMNLVGEYLAIGGMPEAVVKWIESNDPKECFQVHHDLIDSYRQDFQKYAKKNQIKYVDLLFNQIPYFIDQQFQYKNIHGEYRKRELVPCMDLLCKANVIHKIHHTAGNGLPLGAEVNLEWFKVIFLDVALCQAILGFDLSTWFLQPGAEFVNRGEIAEAFVGQELLSYSHPQKKSELYFWKRAAKNSQAEIDFVYDYSGEILPIEVKHGKNGKLKSLHLFLEEHGKSSYGIRFSSHNYSVMQKIDSRPLYAVASLAHGEQKESLKSLI